MEKQFRRDFLEIRKTIESRINFLGTLDSFTEEEQKIRKQECEILLKKLDKIKYYQLNPLQFIETVKGVSFKLGDKFHIPGDEKAVYTIVAFPDAVTVRGEANNPPIGKPWTCEVYVESAVKIKSPKKVKRVKEKKPKKVNIKVGDYFAIVSNNTIYKAIEVTKKNVVGINKLTDKNAPKRIKTKKKEIILKTKKDYKKQHKAERKHSK